jgi:hypothetical protein
MESEILKSIPPPETSYGKAEVVEEEKSTLDANTVP